MRSFIRHDTELPIAVELAASPSSSDSLCNVSHGGLSFRHATALPLGAQVQVSISVTGPSFAAACRVVWCQPEGNFWQVGVVFLDQEDLYRARLVEQVCQIEQYRKDEQARHGRKLTGQEAALEWIGKFAAGFPRTGE